MFVIPPHPDLPLRRGGRSLGTREERNFIGMLIAAKAFAAHGPALNFQGTESQSQEGCQQQGVGRDLEIKVANAVENNPNYSCEGPHTDHAHEWIPALAPSSQHANPEGYQKPESQPHTDSSGVGEKLKPVSVGLEELGLDFCGLVERKDTGKASQPHSQEWKISAHLKEQGEGLNPLLIHGELPLKPGKQSVDSKPENGQSHEST